MVTCIIFFSELFYLLFYNHSVLMPGVAGPLVADGVLVNGQVWPHTLLEPDPPPGAWQLAIWEEKKIKIVIF